MKHDLAAELREVEPDRRAGCAIDIISASRRTWSRTNRPPKPLSAREALVALEFEALVVSVAACNLANGVALSDDDRARLLLAYQLIDVIVSEI